jgi:23S rRNA (cytosine1962-C5)-methyltransferase
MPDHGLKVVLRPRRAKPFFMRHPWLFSGAVQRVEGDPANGDVVEVLDADGRFVGRGFYSAASQIAARLFCWEREVPIDDAFWRARLDAAIRLRTELLRLPDHTDAFRWVYSDSDRLPGLIVDRYGDYLVCQFQSAGMSQRRDGILEHLSETLKPKGIYDRGDEETLAKEGIAPLHGMLRGEPAEGPVEVNADGLRFLVDLAAGQKTGFYLDQRENRLAAARYLRGRTVLDAFCYTGAFGIAALRIGGAAAVTALDSSASALQLARQNFELNGATDVEVIEGAVSTQLRRLKDDGRRFGAVILDPPKFARSRAGVPRALRAYRDANLIAMQLLEEDGVLVTCSCSGHVGPREFLLMLNDAATEAGVGVAVLEQRGQAADHPVIASCPETGYLKCFICRVTR